MLLLVLSVHMERLIPKHAIITFLHLSIRKILIPTYNYKNKQCNIELHIFNYDHISFIRVSKFSVFRVVL